MELKEHWNHRVLIDEAGIHSDKDILRKFHLNSGRFQLGRKYSENKLCLT